MNTLPPIENHDINDTTVPLFQIMPKPKNKTRVSRDLNRATPFNKEYKNSVLLFDYDEGTQSKIGNTGKTLYTRQIEEEPFKSSTVEEDNLGDQALKLPSLTPVPPIYPKTTFASTRIKRRTINPNKVTRNNTGGKKKKNKSKKRNRNKNSKNSKK